MNKHRINIDSITLEGFAMPMDAPVLNAQLRATLAHRFAVSTVNLGVQPAELAHAVADAVILRVKAGR